MISNAQTLPIKQLAARAVLARLGMASLCTLRMKAAGLRRGMTDLQSMSGDTGRMAHPSGAAIEASFRGRKGETKSLRAVCIRGVVGELPMLITPSDTALSQRIGEGSN